MPEDFRPYVVNIYKKIIMIINLYVSWQVVIWCRSLGDSYSW